MMSPVSGFSDSFFLDLAIAVWLLPFCSFLLLFLLQSYVKKGLDYLASLTMLVALAGAGFLFYKLWFDASLLHIDYIKDSYRWFSFPTADGKAFDVNILLDKYATLMLVIVTLISFLVHLYSI